MGPPDDKTSKKKGDFLVTVNIGRLEEGRVSKYILVVKVLGTVRCKNFGVRGRSTVCNALQHRVFCTRLINVLDF